MSEVQRYICEGDDHSAEMVPCGFGGWVSYEDHVDALAASVARRDALEREVERLREALEDVRRVEAWLEADPDKRYIDVSRGVFCMVEVTRADEDDVPAESIEALGRALAQEAGDAG